MTVTPIKTKSLTFKSSKKSVNFNKTVKVILIPTVKEYREANLHGYVWLTREDMMRIDLRAKTKFVEFLKRSKVKHSDQDIKNIYKTEKDAFRAFLDEEGEN